MADNNSNKMGNRIISIVGMCGAGKTDVSDFLKKKGFSYVRFGDITMDELKKRNLEINEKNERFIRESLRKEYGMAVYAKLTVPKLESLLKEGNVIADGLYSWEEYLLLKERFGENIIVLNIQTSPETRTKRLASRKIRPLTKEEVASRDKSEIENLKKGGPIAMADYTITNEGTPENLENSLNIFYNWINGGN